MKSVLISIKPKWCELIARGEKTVEVRKGRPKIETPFKCYIYCTKGYVPPNSKAFKNGWFGYVIGEFVCDLIYPLAVYDGLVDVVDCKTTCMTAKEILEYDSRRVLYGWHISDLVIYDEPEMLHHFFKPCGDCDKKGTKRCTEELTDCRAKVITRPPQSWCYVEERKMR